MSDRSFGESPACTACPHRYAPVWALGMCGLSRERTATAGGLADCRNKKLNTEHRLTNADFRSFKQTEVQFGKRLINLKS